MTFKNPKTKRRVFRVIAICLGVGLAAPSAGSAIGMDFVTSATFGALMVLISLVSTLLITFGVKDGVSDAEFDKTLREAAEQASKATKKE